MRGKRSRKFELEQRRRVIKWKVIFQGLRIENSSMSEGNMTMKLLIDRRNNKVVFAEAGKECVNFLFQMLQLPIATVVSCLTKEAMVGSLGSLYDSLLKPRGGPAPLPFSTIKEATAPNYPLYRCPYCPTYASDSSAASCPSCRNRMTQRMTYVPLTEVDGLFTYMITDDLVIKPMSGILSIELLGNLDIKDLDLVEHREVILDSNQGMALLNASWTSKTVLTDVFLGQKDIKVKPISGQPVGDHII